MMNTKILKIIKTARPFSWPFHLTSFIFGAYQTHSFNIFSVKFLIGVLIFTLPYSLFIYSINDYYDFPTDVLNPRKGGIFGAKHQKNTKNNLLTWGFSGFLISAGLACFLGIPSLTALLVLSLILYSYSAPPLRLKSIPVLDALSGGGFYAYFTVFIGFLAFNKSGVALSDFVNPLFILFFLIGMMLQMIGAVFDEVPDKKNGIKTSSIYFGKYKILLLCFVLLLASLYIAKNNAFLKFFMYPYVFVLLFAFKEKVRGNSLFQKAFFVFGPFLFFLLTVFIYFYSPNLLIL